MNNKLVTLFTFGIVSVLPLALLAQSSSENAFVSWDFTAPANQGKGLDEVVATGTTGAGNVFNGNFDDSSVFDSARGYSIRRSGSSENLYAPTGITALDDDSVWVVVDFAGWNFPVDEAVNINIDASNDPASGNYPAAAFRLLSPAGSDRVRLQAYGVGGFSGSDELSASANGVTIALNLKRDSYEATLYYKTEGGKWQESITVPQFGRNDRKVGAVKIVENGSLSESNSVDIKSITVTSSSPVPGA